MKVASFALCLLLGAFLATGDAHTHGAADKTITKVVKLLQRMLDKSKKEADDDKNAYAKYECYVDSNEAEKTASVKKLGEDIELLESKIAELQAGNGELSGKVASLEANMAGNEAGQKAATEVRKQSAKSFKAMETDLDMAIGQMQEALDVLTAISLDQTKSAAFKAKFMAGFSKDKKDAMLLNLGSEVKNALNAVSALLPSDSQNHATLKAFLQAPLAAAHTAQGDAIVGILKSLMDTFKGNLVNARDSEKAEKKAFEGSVDVLKSSYSKMEKMLKEKKENMASNDNTLSSHKTSHTESLKQKKSDEEFLESLRDMAAKKAKDYDERKMMRANEDAAIAQAISILNSDAAFENFGKVDATSKGKVSFLQLRVRDGVVRQQAEVVLEQANSARLERIAKALRAGNAFNTVLKEIEKMKKVIVEEGAADKENKEWCTKERTFKNKDLDAKNSQIKTLNGAIEELGTTINDPVTGLKQQITETETSLLENGKAQVDQTKTRKSENAAYQEDISNLSEAEDILGRAIAVLGKYYKALAKKQALLQLPSKALLVQAKAKKGREDPAPPETYDAFSGQSKSGGEAINMLKFILSETEKEHATADKDEKTAQTEFDDSMDKLKKDEIDMQKGMVKLKSALATRSKELLEKEDDLKDTTAAKESIEKYLLQIKPGCDFIAENFDVREKNRSTETEALDKAVTGFVYVLGEILDFPSAKSLERLGM